MNGQGHFLTIFCLWSHLFLTFAWYHQSPVAILIQPRDLCAMVRGWTPDMTPRYHFLPRQKKFRHANTIRRKWRAQKHWKVLTHCSFATNSTPNFSWFLFELDYPERRAKRLLDRSQVRRWSSFHYCICQYLHKNHECHMGMDAWLHSNLFHPFCNDI